MKSYNPFKMWGSWIGAIVGYLFGNGLNICISATCKNSWNFYILPEASWVYFSVYAVFGFLLGWGIHSLVRWLRR